MFWRVTYHRKDGKQTVENFEAESRAKLFKILASRGISAIRVEDAVEHKLKGSRKMVERRFAVLRFLVWAIVIGAAVALAYMFLSQGGGSDEIAKGYRRIKDRFVKSGLIAEKSPELKGVEAGAPEDDTWEDDDETSGDSQRGDAGSVAEETATAKPTPPPPPTYKSNSDELIAMAMSVPADAEIPPLPFEQANDDQFVESFSKPVEILDTDSEAVKKMKRTVMEARMQIAEMMKNGASFQEVLTEHRELFNSNVQVRNDCLKELQEIFDSGDYEGAQKYVDTMNIALQQMGIQELEMPLTLEEKIERAKEAYYRRLQEKQEMENRQ